MASDEVRLCLAPKASPHMEGFGVEHTDERSADGPLVRQGRTDDTGFPIVLATMSRRLPVTVVNLHPKPSKICYQTMHSKSGILART